MFRQFGLPADKTGSHCTSILGTLAKSCRRREIMFFGVLADCAICRKGRSQARHTFAHARNPPAWNSILVTGIKLWDNFPFEHCIETLSVSCVPRRIISMFVAISDR